MRNKFVLVLVLVFVTVLPLLAHPPMPELDGDIVMQGLNGPQGLYVDADGNLWVIDSGFGGSETIQYFNTQTFEPIEATFGQTSRVLRLSPDGEMTEVATLPSIAAGEDFLGGARLAVLDDILYATVGGWHVSLGDNVTVDNYTAVVSITDDGVETVADLWAHELTHNPDETGNIESHPYGITAGAEGLLYVTDAAANAVISVDPSNGETNTVVSFEGLPGVFPNPWRDGELVTDPVPTATVFGEDGKLYVSFLSGAPFIPGSAKVVQVDADGNVSDYSLGHTMLTDLQTAPDGNLYAVSFGMFTEEGPVFNSGSIIRILSDGSAEVVVDGLPFATGLAIDAEGNGYVAINGIAIPEAGIVVYYEGLTDMEGVPISVMEMEG